MSLLQGDFGKNYKEVGEDILIIKTLLKEGKTLNSALTSLNETNPDQKKIISQALNPQPVQQANVDVKPKQKEASPITRVEPEKSNNTPLTAAASTLPQKDTKPKNAKENLNNILDDIKKTLIPVIEKEGKDKEILDEHLSSLFGQKDEPNKGNPEVLKLIELNKDNISGALSSFYISLRNLKTDFDTPDIYKKEKLIYNFRVATKKLTTLANDETARSDLNFIIPELDAVSSELERSEDKKSALDQSLIDKAFANINSLATKIEDNKYIHNITNASNLEIARDQYWKGSLSQVKYHLKRVDPELKAQLGITDEILNSFEAPIPIKSREGTVLQNMNDFQTLIKTENYDEEKAKELLNNINYGLIFGLIKTDPKFITNFSGVYEDTKTLQSSLKNDLNVGETDSKKTNTFDEALSFPYGDKYQALISPDRIAELPVYVNRREISGNEKTFLEDLTKLYPGLKTLNKANPTEAKEVSELDEIISVLKRNNDFFSKDGILGIQVKDIKSLEQEANLKSGSLYDKLETLAQSYGKPVPAGKEK